MKKILIVLTCVCILAVMALPALAAEEIEIVITPNKTEVNRGDEISFEIGLKGSVQITSVYFSLEFPEDVFEFKDSKKAEALNGFVPDLYSKDHPEIGLFSMTPSSFEGIIQTITFKVKADAKFGKTTILATPQGAQCNGENVSVKMAKVEVTVACKHSYTTWTKVDATNHKSTCSVCQAHTETQKHTWDNGTVTKTTGCETPGEKTYKCTAKGCDATKVEAIKVTGHSWDNGTVTKKPGCETSGEKTYKCKNCDATKVETLDATGHAWDNDCDGECNNGCGTKRDVSHKYAEKYSNDAKGHWYPCTICGDKKDYYDHTPDREAATEDDAQLCKYCGYVIANKLPHEHDVSPQIQKDAEGHWYYCNKGGCYMRIDLAEHVYDDDCDLDCNVCEYIRIPPHKYMPEWRGGQEGHWRVCSLCNAESEILPHTPGEPATDENPQLCVDCHFWIQWPLSHEHTFNEEWEHDEEGHWQVCTECQGHSEIQEHTWDEGTVILQPTETEEGTKKFLCTVCQEEKTEAVPVIIPTEPSEEPSEPMDATEPGVPGESEGFPWWIVGAAAGVLLVVGIVLLVIELIRSRKTNMHGKFSK